MLSKGPKRPNEPKLRFEEGIRGFEAAKQAAVLALSEVMGQFPEVSVHFTVGMPFDPWTSSWLRSLKAAWFQGDSVQDSEAGGIFVPRILLILSNLQEFQKGISSKFRLAWTDLGQGWGFGPKGFPRNFGLVKFLKAFPKA